MAKILVCDDDKEIVEAIDIYLTQEGYEVLKAYDGIQALKLLETQQIDLLVMDVMMPRLDGVRATLKIRENNNVPIIILSAKSEDADKILGLNVGADDYVTKPFNPLELVARVKSQLRRYTKLGCTSKVESAEIYSTGGLVINDDRKEVTVDGEMVKLTPIEYNILLSELENNTSLILKNEIYISDNKIKISKRCLQITIYKLKYIVINNIKGIIFIHLRLMVHYIIQVLVQFHLRIMSEIT